MERDLEKNDGCAICDEQGPKSYTIVKGEVVCMGCIDLILRLFPDRLDGPITCPNPECTNGYLLDELQHERDVPPKCEICEGKGTVENVSRCEVCGTEIVEVTTNDYAPGYLDWWPVPDLPDYHPCADENGLPAAHTPRN